MLAQQNCNVANEGDEANHTADHVLFAVQEGLAPGVELGVVREVVVTLGEQTKGCLTVILSVQAVFTYVRQHQRLK